MGCGGGGGVGGGGRLVGVGGGAGVGGGGWSGGVCVVVVVVGGTRIWEIATLIMKGCVTSTVCVRGGGGSRTVGTPYQSAEHLFWK